MSAELRSTLDTTNDGRYQASRRVTFVSIVWNLILTVVQILIGIVANSSTSKCATFK